MLERIAIVGSLAATFVTIISMIVFRLKEKQQFFGRLEDMNIRELFNNMLTESELATGFGLSFDGNSHQLRSPLGQLEYLNQRLKLLSQIVYLTQRLELSLKGKKSSERLLMYALLLQGALPELKEDVRVSKNKFLSQETQKLQWILKEIEKKIKEIQELIS